MTVTLPFRLAALALLLPALARAADAPKASAAPVDLTAIKPGDDFKPHKAEDGSWAAKYPPTWEVKKTQSGSDMFMAPMVEGAKFRQNVIIKPLTVPPETTIAAAGRDAEADIVRSIPNVVLDASAPLTTPSHAGHILIYHAPFQTYQLKWAQGIIISGGKAYLLTFTAEAAAFDQHWPAVQQIFASFKG